MTTFHEFGVRPETADALAAAGITEPFPIQAQTLPLALSGNDVIGQAKTGTGKTLAFGVPLLERVEVPAKGDTEADPRPQALVVVPTRELCVQVTKDIQAAGRLLGVEVLAVYGGRAFEPQITALKRGVQVVVGTPGRLLDLVGRGHLRLGAVRALVLDEADEMLDLGFLPDVEKLVAATPASRQTMLFSATMPGQILSLARRYLTKPVHIRANDPDDAGATVAAVTQHAFRAHAMDKTEMLARIMQSEGRGLSIVFCRTKRTAAKVTEELDRRGFAVAAIHGDLGQGAREQALRAFRNGKVDILVATDVAARGIDVENVTHVVNFQCPDDEKTYLHRIGRTGRAGRSGTAVTFVDWDELHTWAAIDRALDLGMREPMETYSTSEHLYTALSIPRESKGKLARAERTRAGLDAEQIEDLGETGRGPKGGRDRGAKGKAGAGRSVRSGEDIGGEKTVAAEPGDAPTARSRRSRSRRRTRSGQPVVAEQAQQAS